MLASREYNNYNKRTLIYMWPRLGKIYNNNIMYTKLVTAGGLDAFMLLTWFVTVYWLYHDNLCTRQLSYDIVIILIHAGTVININTGFQFTLAHGQLF